jgi:pimeloyl-ACP methyl ester carboxylesterase
VAPRYPGKNAALCVVLHSANRTGYDYLAYQFLNRKIDANDDPATVITRVPGDCYALFPNSTNDEWWGWGMARKDMAKYSTTSPPESRVFDTVEWVVKHYKIERNRIYLSGVSMGGCGALGLGLPHGDIFAAVLADVPAGTEYVAFRRGLPAAVTADHDRWLKQISGTGLPDPPPLLDFSAQNDNWSKTQPALLQAALAGRLPLVLAWGPFGHTTFTNAIAKYSQCDVALSYPWLEIRRDEAYPVFTNATSDQHSPWSGTPLAFDESGQMNAYFRWKDRQDDSSKLTMQLWIVHPTVNGAPSKIPDEATADVTFRRLQRFKVQCHKFYEWQLVRGGKLIASGKVSPDAANLLTLHGITLTTIRASLSLKAEK